MTTALNLFLQDRQMQKLLDAVGKLEEIVSSNQETTVKVQEALTAHHEVAGVPWAIAVPVVGALVAALGAVFVLLKAQQKRADEAVSVSLKMKDETIELLKTSNADGVKVMVESAGVATNLTSAINGLKTGVYATRDEMLKMSGKMDNLEREISDLKRGQPGG